MFPQAGRLPVPTLHSVTNPYSLTLAGMKLIVTSGQIVSDILRNSSLAGPLEAWRCPWGHLVEVSGHKVTIIALPKLFKSCAMVRLTLKSLHCDTVCFDVGFDYTELFILIYLIFPVIHFEWNCYQC